MNEINHSTFCLKIRVPKKHSAFTYFQLEANEGLCFYSTLEESLGKEYRDIEIKGPNNFWSESLSLLEFLNQEYPIELLEFHYQDQEHLLKTATPNEAHEINPDFLEEMKTGVKYFIAQKRTTPPSERECAPIKEEHYPLNEKLKDVLKSTISLI
ncbi:MAG: hypothetical protein ACPGJV_09150 [Bacteriovoracaceae bacterium]